MERLIVTANGKTTEYKVRSDRGIGVLELNRGQKLKFHQVGEVNPQRSVPAPRGSEIVWFVAGLAMMYVMLFPLLRL